MRKFLIMSAALAALTLPVRAATDSSTLSPFVVNVGSAAVTIYIVGGATTSAASFITTTSSICFFTAGGLYPGATSYLYSDPNINTVAKFISYLNAKSTYTLGLEGGIVVSLTNGCYDGNSIALSSFSAVTATSIKGSSAAKQLYLGGTSGIYGVSYVLPASGLGWRQQYHLTRLNANATYGSGTVTCTIYDGDKSTCTVLGKCTLSATGVETQILSSGDDYFAGSNVTAMRIDIIGTAAVTAGYFGASGFKR